MKNISALLLGTLFGSGLTISGMTDSEKIIGFLNITENWDASLIFVMGAALLIVIPSFYYIKKMSRPIFEDNFCLPTNSNIDKKLITGALIFGIGWGLYGYCPGPAIATLTYLKADSFLFVATMLLGMFIAGKVTALFSS